MELESRPVCVFVDPSAGVKGVHNSAFVHQLQQFGASGSGTSVEFGFAVHRSCSAGTRNGLAQAQVAVLPVFEVDGYQLTGEPIAPSAWTPYVATLRENFLELFIQVRSRWPKRRVSLVYHTMSWEHLLALGSALRQWPTGGGLTHHAFAMYWPGMAEDGQTIEPALRLQYKQALSALQGWQGFYLYTGTVAYQQALASLLPGLNVRLHPFFLDDWVALRLPAKPLQAESVRKILAYSGEVRDVKGFDGLHAFIPRLLQRFSAAQKLVVHVPLQQEKIVAAHEKTWQALQALAAKDARIELLCGFLGAEQIKALVASCDVVSLAYDAEFYKYKTSGFLWLAGRLGVPCIVPEGTWMAREAARLGVPAWCTNLEPLHQESDRAYAQAVLQPFWPWLMLVCLLDKGEFVQLSTG